MPYKVAAIDIHKKVLMVVVAAVADEVLDAVEAAVEFESRTFGTGAQERRHLVSWLKERQVHEVGMESTAQYWKPIWLDLEPHFAKLHLAQAQSNRAPKGRKNDFRDAKRLGRRFLAGELMLRFVPEPEQRLWRLMTRGRLQLVRDRVRLQSQLEALLEEARIKLSSVVGDLLGSSGRRILKALSEGETDPEKLAELGDDRLRCSKEKLVDALRGPAAAGHLELLKLHLERLELLDAQIDQLSAKAAEALKPHQDAVVRLAEVPGLGVQSAQQLIAEIGVDAGTFSSASEFASWVGVCPGDNISAEENHSSRSPKGNRYVRRALAEAAHAAVKSKRSHFEGVFRKLLPKLGYKGAIWVVAHRLARLIWKILHDGIQYREQGNELNPRAKQRRAQKLSQALRKLGYAVTLTPINPEPAIGSAG